MSKALLSIYYKMSQWLVSVEDQMAKGTHLVDCSMLRALTHMK